MRIVTLNTWKNEGDYARRLGLMARGLQALEPDVVCLQECFAAQGFDTACALGKALGLFVFAQPARSKLRRHEGRPTLSTSGLAVLSRWTPVGEERLVLASDPADGERIAQRLDLETPVGALRLLNLHLTHLRGPEADKLRRRQLEDALAWAAEGLASGLVVTGDLNAGARDPALQVLADALDPDMPSTLLGPHAATDSGRRDAIDHAVLAQPGGWCVAARTRVLDAADGDGWRASDHAGVMLDLSRL